MFHYHHIHKHVILALCRGVLHSAAVSLLIQPKVKTAKSSKKTVSKSEDVLMKVCRVILQMSITWPDSQRSLTSVFVFVLLDIPFHSWSSL